MTSSPATLLRGPVAVAALLIARQERIAPEDLCSPPVAFAVAAEARLELDPWGGDHARRVRRVLGHAAEVKSYAEAVLANPASSWWAQPVDRYGQVLVAGQCSSGVEHAVRFASSAYAQRPVPALITSTRLGSDTCWDVFTGRHVGDEEPMTSANRILLQADPAARVLELHEPKHWRELCLRFPLRSGPGELMPGGLAPDWTAVAATWDAVHLSFFGFLASAFVRVGDGLHHSMLWTWDGEQTLWLRQKFTSSSVVSAAADSDRVRVTSSSLRDVWGREPISRERAPLRSQ